MLEEMKGKFYASVVGSEEDYWNVKGEDGKTIRETAKETAMNNAIKYELMNTLALQEGYTLTQEEKELCTSKAEDIIKNMNPEQLEKAGLSKETLIHIQEKISLATKYYEDIASELKIDESAMQADIAAKINPLDYKQYDFEYIFATKSELKDLEKVSVEAKAEQDFDTISKNADKNTDLNTGKLSFLAGSNTFGEETNLEETITKLKVGEVSDIVETTKGYYILKLTDNTSTESYDKAVQDAIEETELQAFETAFEELKSEHKIVIEDKARKNIEVGSMVIQE